MSFLANLREIKAKQDAEAASNPDSVLSLNKYQDLAKTTALYPGKHGDNLSIQALTYSTLGLVGEAGEIANKIKKIHRGDKLLTADVHAEIAKELGDVLWYVAMIADDLHIPLQSIAEDNLQKLLSRKARNAIKGDGDNR